MFKKWQVWNVSSRTELQSAPLPDMTAIEWSPCGQYFITATCAPRLRVLNGWVLSIIFFLYKLQRSDWNHSQTRKTYFSRQRSGVSQDYGGPIDINSSITELNYSVVSGEPSYLSIVASPIFLLFILGSSKVSSIILGIKNGLYIIFLLQVPHLPLLRCSKVRGDGSQRHGAVLREVAARPPGCQKLQGLRQGC